MRVHCFDPLDINRSHSQFRSKFPNGRETFDKASEFILGHFTSSTFLDSILKLGLLPDFKKERAIEDNVPSDNSSVYLAVNFDRFYLRRATKHHGGKGIIIKIVAPKKLLLPDEAWISNGEGAVDSHETLYRSMCGGVCKHRGVIPPKDILAIYDQDGSLLLNND